MLILYSVNCTKFGKLYFSNDFWRSQFFFEIGFLVNNSLVNNFWKFQNDDKKQFKNVKIFRDKIMSSEIRDSILIQKKIWNTICVEWFTVRKL